MNTIDIERAAGISLDGFGKRLVRQAGALLEYVSHCQLDLDLSVRGKAAPGRQETWDKCWGDLLATLPSEGPISADALIPEFLRNVPSPYRYMSQYITASPGTFLAVQRILLGTLVNRYLGTEILIEYGCGSGHNLAFLRENIPGVVFAGKDWSANALKCVQAGGIPAQHFDMTYARNKSANLSEATVLTAGAMEQLGTGFDHFLRYLLASCPAMCIHIEPLYELYDRLLPFDDTAAAYHESRKYLTGFLPALQQLAQDKKVRIYNARRVRFGNLYNDGLSFIVWRPL